MALALLLFFVLFFCTTSIYPSYRQALCPQFGIQNCLVASCLSVLPVEFWPATNYSALLPCQTEVVKVLYRLLLLLISSPPHEVVMKELFESYGPIVTEKMRTL